LASLYRIDRKIADVACNLGPSFIEGLTDGLQGIGSKSCTVYELSGAHGRCPDYSPARAQIISGVARVYRVRA